MSQVAVRSMRRLVSRTEYYGWKERPSDWLSATHPLRWSWAMTHGYRERYGPMLARPGMPKSVRLRSRANTAALLAGLAQ
jgi:hypothetical protein